LYAYEAGTSTPLSVYSDEALGSALANPVVADGNGWFSEIYMDTTQAYKFVLKDADDTTVFTVDDIYADQLVSNGLVTRVKQVASNPLDYGAVGDGVADESSEVQDAIDNATGVVDLLGKTFRCDSTLDFSSVSDLIFRNGILDFSNAGSVGFLSLTGSLGSSLTVSSDITAGDTTFDLDSVTGLTAGDWLYCTSTAKYHASGVATTETMQIKSISGSTITPFGPVYHSFATADGAYCKEMNSVDNIKFEDLTVLGVASGTSTAVATGYSTNIRFQNVTIDGFGSRAFSIVNSANITISDSTARHGGSATSVCVYAESASRNVLVVNGSFMDCPTGVWVAGTPTMFVTIDSVTLSNNTYDILFRDYRPSEHVTIRGSMLHSASGIGSDTNASVVTNLTIEDNVFDSSTAAIVLDKLEPQSAGQIGDITIRGNRFLAGSVNLTTGAGDTGDYNTLSVTGNAILSGGITIDCSAGSEECLRIDITDNNIDGLPVDITGSSASSYIVVGNNAINASQATATDDDVISIDSAAADVAVTDNFIYGDGVDTDGGVYIRNTSTAFRSTVTGNIIKNLSNEANSSAVNILNRIGSTTVTNNYTDGGYYSLSLQQAGTADVDDCVIANNTFVGSTDYGISISDISSGHFANISITGNMVNTDGFTISTTSTSGNFDNVAITSNILRRTDDVNYNNSIGDIANLTFLSNFIENGTYSVGIDAATVTAYNICDNTYTGASTGVLLTGLRECLDGQDMYTEIDAVASLTLSQCGDIFSVVDAADGDTIDLPDADGHDGCSYKFIFTGSDGGALVDISPFASNAIHGTCIEETPGFNEMSGGDNADVGLVKANSNTGDRMTLLSIGGDWYIQDCVGDWDNN
jgi:hypothetical protein